MSMRVAVLGAGIMGSSLALQLARRGVAVTLFDAAHVPFCGASRWNEGKIHLGFLYSADPSLATARHVLEGSLMFRPTVENLLECTLEEVMTGDDDLFICHRDSLVGLDAMQAYFERVAALVKAHPAAARYLVDVSDCRVCRLSPAEVACISESPEIVGGFSIPERSVATTRIADRYVDALRAESGVEWRMNTCIVGACPVGASADEEWQVITAAGEHDGPYDYVINALWNGRLAIDQQAGLALPPIWSNRYRLALFVRTKRALSLPSVLIATGAFGDVKNYNGRDFYLSWYPEGLLLDSAEVSPPQPVLPGEAGNDAFAQRVMATLETYLPAVAEVRESAESVRVEGGWVYAAGRGALSDPRSTLHRRDEFGVSRRGRYLSVDTGKYATAPWMALKLAESLLDG